MANMGAAINTSTLEVTNEILSLISEIDEFKGAWRAIGRIAPDRLNNLKRVATIESTRLFDTYRRCEADRPRG